MYTKEASKMASFRSVDELNGAIRTHIYRNKSDLTPAAIEVLKVLSRHAETDYFLKVCNCCL
ncbi:hypothetical protein BSU04nite_01600 [Bacillus spizizenii]|nr:hypothetical protein BSU04nite_01600 [Bacillus spizizenii]